MGRHAGESWGCFYALSTPKTNARIPLRFDLSRERDEISSFYYLNKPLQK